MRVCRNLESFQFSLMAIAFWKFTVCLFEAILYFSRVDTSPFLLPFPPAQLRLHGEGFEGCKGSSQGSGIRQGQSISSDQTNWEVQGRLGYGLNKRKTAFKTLRSIGLVDVSCLSHSVIKANLKYKRAKNPKGQKSLESLEQSL